MALTIWYVDVTDLKVYQLKETGIRKSAFVVPSTFPNGLAYNSSDNTLWHCDSFSNLIYNLGLAGTIISSFTSPSTFPQGLSIDTNGTLWHCDSVSDFIYNLGLAGTIISSFTSPSTEPTDIVKAGDNTLWHCDPVSNLIYNLGLAGTIISSFTSPAGNPQGLAMDNDNTLWHCDEASDLIYNLGLAGTIISSFAAISGNPRGIDLRYDAIEKMLKRPKVDIFRKFSVKRRLDDGSGNYESDWQDLSAEVLKWGNIKWKLDDKKYNFFTQRGMSISVKNDQGLFNDENHATSFWNNYLTRYRTLVKIEAGFIDPDDSSIEIPFPSILLYGYITEKIRTGDNNKVVLQIKSLYSILDEIPANKCITASAGSVGQLTASDLIGKIRDMTDGAGNFVLQKFITSGAWNIESTTNTLTALNTTTMLDDITCWGLAKKLAEAENKIVYVDRAGTFNFVSRTENTVTFSFVGYPFQDSTYGHTIKSLRNYQQDIDVLHNRIRIKFGEEDTSTSYITKEQSWQVGDSSTSWIYGVKTLAFENEWMTDTTAEIIASTLLVDLSAIKIKCDFNTKFIPHLDLLDKVTIQYEPRELQTLDWIWDVSKWDEAKWSGENIYDFTGRDFKIIGISHTLDKMESNFILREI